jgi:hypothetical protein
MAGSSTLIVIAKRWLYSSLVLSELLSRDVFGESTYCSMWVSASR